MSTPNSNLDDPDPIRASYDVYIKPSFKDGRQLYILQFPNRESYKPYNSLNHTLPSELRMKPKTGLLELDVPIDAWQNYDRDKGFKWGDALKKSNTGNNGNGSHGLPGGFGIGGTGPRARAGDEEDLQEMVMRDFAAAVTNQRVLTKQTLGGMTVPKEESSPQYMVGAFKKGSLHLTPVDQIVQLRPQFHHIDAASELEKAGRARDAAPGGMRSGEPRAIHMTVKAVGDEEETTDTMAERIRAAQDEKWRKLHYVDENSDEAWQTFEEHLFVPGVPGSENEEDVHKDVPKLVSYLQDAEYLDAISAPRDAAKLSRSRKNGKKGGEGDEEDSDTLSGDSSGSEAEQ